ncbi:MAG: phosphate acyltransferase, partial [Candidatus Neomarinimicrobiota bacterium]
MAKSPVDALGRIRAEAARANRTLVLPEGCDARVVQAAARIDALGLARVVLLGKPLAVQALADDHRSNLSNIQVLDPDKSPHADGIRAHVTGLKFAADLSPDELDTYLSDPVHQGAGMVATGVVDAMVVGAGTSSGEVARTA